MSEQLKENLLTSPKQLNSNTTEDVPLPAIDFSSKIKFVLINVSIFAITLVLFGGWCTINTNMCPPVLIGATTQNSTFSNLNTTNLSPSSFYKDTDAAGIGILMIIIGTATLIPVTIIALLQFCLNIGTVLGTNEIDLLSLGHTEKSIQIKKTAVSMLFASHFLSAWGDRMWQFAVPLLFMEIFVDTLAPTAIYALVVYSACVQFMPSIGGWVDRQHRLIVQRFALLVDNASVVGTSLLLCLLAASEPSLGQHKPAWDMGLIVSFVGVIVLGISGELMNQAQTLAIERDWVIVIANEIGSVPVMNKWMRRIDLSCKVLAPWAVGIIIKSVGTSGRMRVFYGAAAVGVWNAMAYPLELMLTTAVFYAFPTLNQKIHSHEDGTKHSHANGHKDHSHFVHRHILINNDISESKNNQHWETTEIKQKEEVSEEKKGYDVLQNGSSNSNNGGNGSDGDGGGDDDGGNGSGNGGGGGDGNGSKSSKSKSCSIGDGSGGDDGKESSSTLNNNATSGMHWHDEKHGTIQHNHLEQGRGAMHVNDAYFTGGYLKTTATQSGFFNAFKRGFHAYYSHKIFLASVAYTSLWCSVLDNGTLMTAYLLWRHVEPDSIGMWRGIGAIFGLIGTMLFPKLMKMYNGSYEKSGLVSIWIFWLLLAPGLIAFFISGESIASDYTVMVAMAVSRIGLWSFDLAQTQIMQTYIVEEERGLLNSTQTSMYQGFYVLMQIGGIIFHDPSQFAVLVYVSIFVVLGACCVYTYWYTKVSKRD